MTHTLIEKQGRMVGFSRLMRAANICVEPNTVTAHVRSIRNSFKSHDPEFAHIENVRGCVIDGLKAKCVHVTSLAVE